MSLLLFDRVIARNAYIADYAIERNIKMKNEMKKKQHNANKCNNKLLYVT